MKSTIELIRNLRIDHDLTQAEVADILGISQQHYSQYENEAYELPLRHFITLANYYNVSADYLIGKCRSKEKTGLDLIHITKAYTAAQMVRDLMALGEDERERFVQYLSFLVRSQESRKP